MSSVRAAVRKVLRRASRSAELARRLSEAEARLARQNERLTNQSTRLHRHRELIDEIKPTAWRAQTLMDILGAQIAGIEERLQNLTDKVEPISYDPTDDELDEARNLLAEVREEHRRIRVRFGVVTSYEERVRRLEAALAEEVAEAARLADEAARGGLLANAPTHGAVDLPADPPAAREAD
jgi:chromosome segregation ATPase